MTNEQLSTLRERLALLRRHLDIDTRQLNLAAKHELMLDLAFWTDKTRTERALCDINLNNKVVKGYQTAETAFDDLAVLQAFAATQEAMPQEVEAQYNLALLAIDDLEIQYLLSNIEDNFGAIIEINNDADKLESCDWVDTLCRMYRRWSEKNGYEVNESDALPDEITGMRSVTLIINGDLAYGMLKGENGVHRLVRNNSSDSEDKRQTFFATVNVYPLIDDTIDIPLNRADISIEHLESKAKYNPKMGVRVRHAPSGIVTTFWDSYNRISSGVYAVQMLRSQLYEQEVRKRNAERDKIEVGKKQVEWGAQVRSYVLDKHYTKDHRSGLVQHNPEAVLNGDLNDLLRYAILHSGEADDEGFDDL